MVDILPVYNLESIDISLSDDTKNVKKAVVQISDKKQFLNGSPVDNGLYDKAMGTINNKDKCGTCVNIKDKCPGHMGYIDLENPYPLPMTISYIIKFMRVICKTCGHIIISDENFEPTEPLKTIDSVLKYIKESKYKSSSKKKFSVQCDKCGVIMGILEKITDSIFIKYTDTDNKVYQLSPREQLDWVCRVPQSEYNKLGIKIRAEQLFTSKLNVIPNKYRFDKNSKQTNHLTAALDNIFSGLNKNIRNENFVKYVNDINRPILAYIKQNDTGVETKDNSSLMKTLTGKRGHIRGNMLGKTIEKMARSVIICYPTDKVDVIKMSKDTASQLTIEETVNMYNYDKLLKLYENRNEYPGIPTIYKKSKNFERASNIGVEPLEIGDRIERHILDGDTVCFGRQPSLWAECMMKMTVRIVNNASTFGINILACPYFNADFDGDQMTVYVMDSAAVRSEADILMSMENHFINNERITPWLGQEQDTIVGCALLTMPDVKLKRSQVHKLFVRTTIEKLQLDKDFYTGREVIELLIPPITYESTSKFMSDIPPEFIPKNIDKKERNLIIKNGKYIQGIMDATSIKAKKNNSIYHVIYKEYGVKKAMDVLFNMQQVINEFLQFRGFSISIKNFIMSKECREKINLAKQSAIQESIEFSRKLDNGELEAPFGKDMETYFEESQLNILKEVNNKIKAPMLESFNIENNDLFMMIFSGSKGSISNLYHLLGCIGQIDNVGKRLQNKLSYGDTLPWFTRHSYDPVAKGFIPKSIFEGFQLKEMYAQAEKSRNDIITKGLTVAVAGTKSRVSGKSLETCIVDNRLFISSNGRIISLIPNENFFDFKYLEQNKLPWVKMSDEQFKQTYISELSEYNEKLYKIRNKYRAMQFRREEINLDKYVSDTFLTCLNVNRLVNKFIDNSLNEDSLELYEDKYSILFDYLKNKMHLRYGNWEYNFHIKKSLRLLKYTILFELNPNRMKHISYNDLRFIINNIEFSILKAIIDPGTAIGILVTQSIMAPVTQFLIDAHHKSASGGSKTEAMKELDNILVSNIPKNVKIKDSSKDKQKKKKKKHSDIANEIIQIMYIYLKPEYESDESKAQDLINEIEFIKLLYFVKTIKIKYGNIDPKQKIYKDVLDINPNITQNMFLKTYYELELDKEKLLNKNITPQDISNILLTEHENIMTFSGHINDDNPKIIIHIENSKVNNSADFDKWIRSYSDVLLDTKIKGLSGIISAKIYKMIRSKVNENGSIENKVNKYYIRTVGINMDGILNYPEVNPTKVFCNNITIMKSYFGILAARKRIISQLEFILSELEIGHPNYLLYGDIITFSGDIININDTGIADSDRDNFLLRASAKGPLKVINECAVNSVHNKITGVSAPIMTGRAPDIGSFYNKLILNTEFVASNIKSVDSLFE